MTEVEFLNETLTACILFLSDVTRSAKTGRKWPGLVIKLSTMVKPGTGDQDLLSNNNAHASQCKQKILI
jgi:hypothetical protein